IQTHEPNHPLLHLLFQEGYPAFATELLKERQLIGFPPNGYIALIHAQSVFREKAEALLQTLSHTLPTDSDVDILGPISSAMERRAGRYRFQLMLRSDNRQTLHYYVSQCRLFFEEKKIDRDIRWQLDIDPIELF
ncbi:MAG: primosomal protein N', partial [Proteobacteria bacterium]|nr:primosomal protein N' [Pseudomonadota bacterium]